MANHPITFGDITPQLATQNWYRVVLPNVQHTWLTDRLGKPPQRWIVWHDNQYAVCWWKDNGLVGSGMEPMNYIQESDARRCYNPIPICWEFLY